MCDTINLLALRSHCALLNWPIAIAVGGLQMSLPTYVVQLPYPAGVQYAAPSTVYESAIFTCWLVLIYIAINYPIIASLHN